MLFIDRPISAETHALLPTPSPLSWINYAGNPTPMADSSCCLALLLVVAPPKCYGQGPWHADCLLLESPCHHRREEQ